MSAKDEKAEKLNDRVDQFYKWASQLQVEFRNIKQRVGYLESLLQDQFNFHQSPNANASKSEVDTQIQTEKTEEGIEELEAALLARLEKMRMEPKSTQNADQ